MFSVFAFIALLMAVLPFNGVSALNHANPQNDKAALRWQIKDFPTPTGIQTAVNFIPETPESNGSKPTGAPGQTISQIAHEDHPGGISEEVHQVIPGNKFYPTPILSPAPVITNTPTPTPGGDPIDPKPSIGPNPCSPCGGGEGNGKYMCPMMMPCMY